MGNEDVGYFTLFITVPINVWHRIEIGNKYNKEVGGILLTGIVIAKNPGELVVRFKKPRNMA